MKTLSERRERHGAYGVRQKARKDMIEIGRENRIKSGSEAGSLVFFFASPTAPGDSEMTMAEKA